MSRILSTMLGVLLSVAVARATPYWVEYLPAGGLYPEESAWSRSVYGGGAQRWFDNGSLVIDSQASTEIVDSYSRERPGQLDPGRGEVFVMSWRMRTDELHGPWDSAVAVFSDERRLAALDFSLNAVHVSGVGFVATFEPGAFHNFEFRSIDMLTYNLYIDDALAYEGGFTVPLLTASKVFWGDETQGGASLTHWDCFRFGVVPEPESALMGVALLMVARAASRAKSS